MAKTPTFATHDLKDTPQKCLKIKPEVIPLKSGNHQVREVAQAGSAPGLGPGGRRFESCLPDRVTFQNVQKAHKINSL